MDSSNQGSPAKKSKTGDQFHGASSSRDAQHVQDQMKMVEALSFVKLVRRTLGGESQKFKDFLQVVIDFKNNRITTKKELGERVEELLKDHPNLVPGLSTIFSQSEAIIRQDQHPGDGRKDDSTPPRNPIPVVTKETVKDVMSKLKEAMIADPLKFKDFGQVMIDYTNNRITPNELVERMIELFKDHPNLVSDVVNKPPAHDDSPQDAPTSPRNTKQVEYDEALSYILVVKERLDPQKYDVFRRVLSEFRDNRITPTQASEVADDLLKGHPDLLSGFAAYVPTSNAIGPPRNTNPLVTFETARELINKIKNNDWRMYQTFIGLLQGHLSDEIPGNRLIPQVIDLFEGHKDLLEEFKELLPD